MQFKQTTQPVMPHKKKKGKKEKNTQPMLSTVKCELAKIVLKSH